MEESSEESSKKNHAKYTKAGVPYVALPHLRDTNLGDEQEKAPTHKEARRRALHFNGTL